MIDANADSPTPLSDLFDGGNSQSPVTSPATEEKVDDATEETEASPKVERKTAPAPDETPVDTDAAEKPVEKPAPTPKEVKAEKKAKIDKEEAEKVAAEKAAEDEAVKAKFDDDANPFKKRYEDTAKWAREIGGENQQLKQTAAKQQAQLEKMQKQIDGTWTDEDDAAEQVGNTPEDIATRSKQEGKAIASHHAAVREHGAEMVKATLGEFHQLFNGHRAIQQAVADSDSPVYEALAIMERYKFEQEYGQRPSDWVKSISEKAVKAETARIRREILAEIKDGKSTKDRTPGSLSSVAGTAGDSGTMRDEKPTPLKELFG